MNDTNRYAVTITVLTTDYIKPLINFLADNDVFIYPFTNDKEYIIKSEVSGLILFRTNSRLSMNELGELLHFGFESFGGLYFSMCLLQETNDSKALFYGSNITADRIVAPPKAVPQKKANVEYLKLVDKNHES
jgi:hypothetical protein